MFKKNIPYLGFNDFWFVILGIPIVGFFMPIFFFGQTLSDGFFPYVKEWIIGIIYTIAYWTGSRKVLIEIRKKFHFLKDAIKRNFYQIVLVIVYAAIIGPFVALVSKPFFTYLGSSHDITLSAQVGTYGVILLSLAIYEVIYLYSQLKSSIEEKEEAKRAQLISELEGLRSQVNPHFLFNSLNTLMNIVAEDQQLAISFLKKLSKVYRYVLESRNEQLIVLSQEMNFMEAYIFLQKERFQNNLNIEIDIPDKNLKHKVIPLALQILFENAIKHNIVSSKKPLTIKLFVDEKKIIVQNNLQRKRSVSDSTQFGLKNVRTRYKIFTEQEVEVIETERFFTVKMPLLKN